MPFRKLWDFFWGNAAQLFGIENCCESRFLLDPGAMGGHSPEEKGAVHGRA